MLGNLITLQIILRNEIPGNNDLFKVTNTQNKEPYSETWNIQKLQDAHS